MNNIKTHLELNQYHLDVQLNDGNTNIHSLLLVNDDATKPILKPCSFNHKHEFGNKYKLCEDLSWETDIIPIIEEVAR